MSKTEFESFQSITASFADISKGDGCISSDDIRVLKGYYTAEFRGSFQTVEILVAGVVLGIEAASLVNVTGEMGCCSPGSMALMLRFAPS